MARYIGLDGMDTTAFELAFSVDNQPFHGVVPVSNPPVGCHRVCNIFITPAGKLVIEYSDLPVARED